MCWTSNKHPIKKTADKDITCYKIFLKEDIVWEKTSDPIVKKKIKEVLSSYMKYVYIPYNANPKINIIYTGYNINNDKYRDSYWQITRGYHSYETLDKAKFHTSHLRCIIKCLIPKGVEYYINEYHEVVSSNIIVTDEIIELWKKQ